MYQDTALYAVYIAIKSLPYLIACAVHDMYVMYEYECMYVRMCMMSMNMNMNMKYEVDL